ncbi:MAG: glutathione S-transferase family protein, partial [Myxococcota bacterium]
LLTRSWAPVDQALEGMDYLIGEFSAADVQLGHAAVMSNRLGCITDDMKNLKAYVARLEARPAFQKAESVK